MSFTRRLCRQSLLKESKCTPRVVDLIVDTNGSKVETREKRSESARLKGSDAPCLRRGIARLGNANKGKFNPYTEGETITKLRFVPEPVFLGGSFPFPVQRVSRHAARKNEVERYQEGIRGIDERLARGLVEYSVARLLNNGAENTTFKKPYDVPFPWIFSDVPVVADQREFFGNPPITNAKLKAFIQGV